MNNRTKWMLGILVGVLGYGVAWATDPPTMSHEAGISNVTTAWSTPTTLTINYDLWLRLNTQDPGVQAANPNHAGVDIAIVFSAKTPGGQTVVSTSELLPANSAVGCQPPQCPSTLNRYCGTCTLLTVNGPKTKECSQAFQGPAGLPCGYSCCGYTEPSWPPSEYACSGCSGIPDPVLSCNACGGIIQGSKSLEFGTWAIAERVRNGSLQLNVNALNFTDSTEDDNVASGGIPQ